MQCENSTHFNCTQRENPLSLSPAMILLVDFDLPGDGYITPIVYCLSTVQRTDELTNQSLKTHKIGVNFDNNTHN